MYNDNQNVKSNVGTWKFEKVQPLEYVQEVPIRILFTYANHLAVKIGRS